jgi:hypothetical protein
MKIEGLEQICSPAGTGYDPIRNGRFGVGSGLAGFGVVEETLAIRLMSQASVAQRGLPHLAFATGIPLKIQCRAL